MSDNKPTWVDYANLASNVSQNAQLANVHSTLVGLGALQAHKALAEMNEQQAREREDQLREYIWKLEHEFDINIGTGAMSASAVYVTVKQIQDGMEKCGVSTASFRQFADKDRVGGFCQKLQQSVEASVSQLTEQQRNDVESYIRYLSEAQELDFLIDYQEKYLRLMEAFEKEQTGNASGAKRLTSLLELEFQQKYNLWQKEAMEMAEQDSRASPFRPGDASTLGWIFMLGGGIGFLFAACADSPEWEVFGALTFFAGLLGVIFDKKVPQNAIQKQGGEALESQDAKAAWLADYQQTLAHSKEEQFKLFGERQRLLEKYKAGDLAVLMQLKKERELFMANFKQANNL